MTRRPGKHRALPELLVTHPAQLASCLSHLAKAPLIGFDTEFVGEDAYRPELCLVQVATAEELFVIDPFTCGPLEDFWRLLLDPNRTVIVHAGREDVRMCYFQVGQPPAHVFDVQIAAGLVGLTYPIGYGGLVSELLHQRMHKGETLTDWRRRPLTPAQVRYAYDDVRFLLPAHRKLSERLKRLKRTEWATEEFSAFVRKAVAEDAAVEKWRKLKGLGALDRRGLAIAREVYRWRERFAERVNRPPRYMMRDDLLVEVARRGPTKPEDLHTIRGLPKGQEDTILEAVKRAKALPLEQCPEPETRENDPANVVLLGNLLGVVLADFAARNRIAANLIASGSDLKSVVRSQTYNQPLPDVPLCRGWRAAIVLPELLDILSGETALRVKDLKADDPLELVELEPEDADELQEGAHAEKPAEGEPVPPSDPNDGTL